MAALCRLLLSLILGAAVVANSACALMKPIRPIADPTRPPYSRIEAGDYVVLHLRDGTRAEFTVQTVDRDGIVAANGVRYSNADITRAEVRVMTKRKAIVVSALVAGGVFLVMVALAYGSAMEQVMW